MEQHLKIAGFLAKLSDSQFKIGKFKFGIDPIIGAIPVVGDAIGLFLALYIYGIAHKMKVSRWHKFQMLGNIVLDLVIGAIPVVGDLFDFGFKANLRNYKILILYRKGKFIEGEIVE